jgi:hypothetical protein
MTAPTVSTLPTAPSRLSKPASFITDSQLFLGKLPAFRTGVNTLATYINSSIPNKWNFGKVNGVRDFPAISQTLLTNIGYDGDSTKFVGDLDDLWLVLEAYSTAVNSAGVWYDSVVAEVGLGSYDLDKPMVSSVSAPMHRAQSVEGFNNSAEIFCDTAVDHINSLYQAMWHTYQTSAGNRSFGSITDTAIITHIIGGSITDTNLTY